jgi:hypothetical protein
MARSSAFRRRLLIWLVVADLVAAARTFVDWGVLLHRLSGRPLLERVWISSDEWSNFLARSGRAGLQRVYEDAQRRDRHAASRIAPTWTWLVEQRDHLPLDARVYLDAPTILLYYHANFIWFPRPVQAAPEPHLVKDDVTLREAVRPVISAADRVHLRDLGYTHLLQSTTEGPRLECLGGAAKAAGP